LKRRASLGNFFLGFPVARAKIADMITGSAPPSVHHLQHEHGESDEVDATGLVGAGGITLPWDDLFIQTFFESLDGFYTYGSGSGVVSVNNYGIKLTSGSTAGSIAASSKSPIPLIPQFNWAKNSTLHIGLQHRINTSSTSLILLLIGQPANLKHVGFKILNNVLYGTIGNGAAETTVSLGSAGSLNSSVTHRLKAVYTLNTKVEFYVDGSKVDEITSGFPSGTETIPSFYYIRVENPGVAEEKWAQIGHWLYHQEA